MKWNHKDNGDWEALGDDGDFLVWKDGSVWKGRYRSKDHKKHFFLPSQRLLSDMKTLCQDNYLWEDSNVRDLKQKSEIRACLSCKFPVSKCKGTCYRRKAI